MSNKRLSMWPIATSILLISGLSFAMNRGRGGEKPPNKPAMKKKLQDVLSPLLKGPIGETNIDIERFVTLDTPAMSSPAIEEAQNSGRYKEDDDGKLVSKEPLYFGTKKQEVPIDPDGTRVIVVINRSKPKNELDPTVWFVRTRAGKVETVAFADIRKVEHVKGISRSLLALNTKDVSIKAFQLTQYDFSNLPPDTNVISKGNYQMWSREKAHLTIHGKPFTITPDGTVWASKQNIPAPSSQPLTP